MNALSCCSCTDDGGIERRQAAQVEAQLKKDRKMFEREFKLLLLGTGESGKSTIVKQMKIIHLNGFKTEQERCTYKSVIFSNVIQSMKSLLKGGEKLGIALNPANAELATKVLRMETSAEAFTADAVDAIETLWKSAEVQQAFANSSSFQLNDSAKYYLDDLARLRDADYVPTVQDVLRSRVITTGIQETEFTYKNTKFRMVDVGGQRNERRKWIHCFQDVTAIIFCVALSEYDQNLYEDESQNRMIESLLLFDEITNSRWFANTSMILFLNKMDLFREKIQVMDLAVCFPEYADGKNYDKGLTFIKRKFVSLNKNPDKRKIYTHETCATDTRNIKFVFEAVRDIITQKNLQDSGF